VNLFCFASCPIIGFVHFQEISIQNEFLNYIKEIK
jgi:hypothetical protein